MLTVIRNIVPHLSCDDCDQETLETLVQVLRSPPPVLLYLLTSDAGLEPGHGSSMEESVVSVS